VIVTLLVLLGGLVLLWGAPRFVRAWRHAEALDLPGQRPSPNGKPADGREVVEEIVSVPNDVRG
jgi:hypothetical protein